MLRSNDIIYDGEEVKMRLFLTVLLFLQLLIVPISAISAPVLAIDDYEINVGDTSTIDIQLFDIEDVVINAFSFKIDFDPVGLTASDLIAGEIIPASSSFWFQGSVLDGQLVGYYSPFLQDLPRIASDGVLASFNVEGLAPGQYELSIAEFAFSDITMPVDVEFQNGSINVVPIPSSLILLGCSLVGVVAFRRKRQ